MARVLITGCSTGFGRAAAVELTGRGHQVVATARRPEVLADLDVAARLALEVDDDASVRAAVDPQLRWPVDADAEMVVAARASSSDEEFEAAMRATLGLTW